MSATIDEIVGFLTEEEMKFRRVPEKSQIHLVFGTQSYRDADGDAAIYIIIDLSEDGEYVKFLTPKAYIYKEGPHKLAVFQTLLQVSWATKLVQFEYDHRDGEIRALIEFPLEDSKLTKRQVMRCISGLAAIIDKKHPEIQAAIERGEINTTSKNELMDAFREFLAQKGISPPPGLLPDEPLPE